MSTTQGPIKSVLFSAPYATAILRAALVQLDACRSKCPGIGGDCDAGNLRYMIEARHFTIDSVEQAALVLDRLSRVLKIDAESEVAALYLLIALVPGRLPAQELLTECERIQGRLELAGESGDESIGQFVRYSDIYRSFTHAISKLKHGI